MLTTAGHLTYCTNIHAGESWEEHFTALKKNFPFIKQKVSPEKPMGIGLRLSNEASVDLIQKDNLSIFKEWLKEQEAYVFTMNGFPYGGFHHKVIKDQVHTPDWTTKDRVDYTLRLIHLLTALVPRGMEGGISTSPLSYKPWFKDKEAEYRAGENSTKHIITVIENLIYIHNTRDVLIHLDIEPEPDGLLETGNEFIDWFENELLPAGIPVIKKKFNVSTRHAEDLIKEHLRLCYDVCHFAIGYEPHEEIIKNVLNRGIKIGKIQISAALKAEIHSPEKELINIKTAFEKYNEPVYLHQVIARLKDGGLLRYRDLSDALSDSHHHSFEEWRAHFHVPVFAEDFGLLQSTRDEIKEVLTLQKSKPFTHHLEVETYTWEVLPPELKLPLEESITREMIWVKQIIDS